MTLECYEAALCGCAVLANDIPSLQEVWGQGALYFHDKDSLKSLLDRLCGDPAYLEKARRRSIRQAAIYSAGATTERYLELFRTVSTRTEACHAA